MTREEEIKKAARAYISGDILSSPSILIHFANGAGWSDLHPNLERLWHDAVEEPMYNELMLGMDSDGVSLYKWCGQGDSWNAFCGINGLVKWAYISDLLPKGGER